MPEKTPEPVQGNQLSRLLSSHTLELLEGKGLDLLQQVGIDVIQQILLDILSGKNLRDFTELLTRSRSDATLLYKMGQGVRFDIGFIGRGNSEISLDKVSRFQRQEEINGSKWYMATIIIVDRLGKNSRVEALARQIGGSIVQMSATYWPQEVARLLKQALGFDHPLADMEQSQIEDYLKEKLQAVPLESFLRNLPAEDLIENEP